MIELPPASKHEQFMIKALEAAKKGRGRTGTNPLVGAGLVKNEEVVGFAGHLKFGEPHAEARLLSKYEEEARGADLYCTLEPCTHSGKTPPCLPRVIDSGVKRVILAHSDPNPEVSGRGIKRLVAEGIEVVHPVLRRKYRELNRAYFYRLGSGLPWVEIKLALSADGYIASSTHHSQWLNSAPSRVEVHRQRARADAVMVGGNTMRKDDPKLTVRHVERAGQPRAIIVTAHPQKISLDSYLLTERAEETIIIVPSSPPDRWLEKIQSRGITVVEVELTAGKFNWNVALRKLTDLNVGRIFVEGGGGLAGSLVEAQVANELHLFYCGKILGDGIKSFRRDNNIRKVYRAPEAEPVEHKRYAGDIYVRRMFRAPLERAGMVDVYDRMTREDN